MNFVKKFSWCMLFACVFSFFACSSDDDETGGGTGNTQAGVVGDTGKRIWSVKYDSGSSESGYDFAYDNNGRLAEIMDYYRYNNSEDYSSYEFYNFSYDPNLIEMIEYYDGEEESRQTVNVSYTSEGFISKISGSYKEIDEDEEEEGSFGVEYGYDKSGRIISGKYSENGNGWEMEDGRKEKYSFSGTSTTTFVWSGSRLTDATMRETWSEKGTGWTDKDEYYRRTTFKYNNAYSSDYQQWAPFVEELIFDAEPAFFYVGLLGKGPGVLPTSYTCEWEEIYDDGHSYDGEDSGSYSYTFENDGRIKTMSNKYYTYKYSYESSNHYGGNQKSSKILRPIESKKMVGVKHDRKKGFFNMRRNSRK